MEEETKQITQDEKVQLREKLNSVNRKLLTLQWDKDHNQLNSGMESKYNELKTQEEKLQKQIEN